jgi:hypothetical protein
MSPAHAEALAIKNNTPREPGVTVGGVRVSSVSPPKMTFAAEGTVKDLKESWDHFCSSNNLTHALRQKGEAELETHEDTKNVRLSVAGDRGDPEGWEVQVVEA